jgi:RNA polymerase sigma-70 factor (ECF subfamily)
MQEYFGLLSRAARHKLIDAAWHGRVRMEAAPHLLAATEEVYEMTEKSTIFPDDRLKLLFVCVHIPRWTQPHAHGWCCRPCWDSARIASAFLVQPSAMGQRLSRAKAKIRFSGLRFELPEAKQLPERLGLGSGSNLRRLRQWKG